MGVNAKRKDFWAANASDKQTASPIVKEEEVLPRFDSGRVITRVDATRHVLALGSAGAGKSQAVVYPSLLNLLKSGAFGLIIDINGNMRGNIGALAETCGREGDLVEYGTSESASPLNLLNGMDRRQMRKFLGACRNMRRGRRFYDTRRIGTRRFAKPAADMDLN